MEKEETSEAIWHRYRITVAVYHFCMVEVFGDGIMALGNCSDTNGVNDDCLDGRDGLCRDAMVCV